MTKSNDKKNQRRGGFYWLDNKPYASVTTILRVIDKPQLRYWFGKQVYLAMVANPSLSEKEAMAAPYAVSDKARSRGTTVHSIVEAYKHSKKHIDEQVAEEWKGYAKSYYKAMEELHINVLEHERTVVSEKHRYAGTLDVLAKVGDSELPNVIDIKTGKDIYSDYALQVSAYKYALEESGIHIKEASVLLLREDGTYKYEVMPDKIDAFLAAKTLWEGINSEDLLKIGYLK